MKIKGKREFDYLLQGLSKWAEYQEATAKRRRDILTDGTRRGKMTVQSLKWREHAAMYGNWDFDFKRIAGEFRGTITICQSPDIPIGSGADIYACTVVAKTWPSLVNLVRNTAVEMTENLTTQGA